MTDTIGTLRAERDALAAQVAALRAALFQASRRFAGLSAGPCDCEGMDEECRPCGTCEAVANQKSAEKVLRRVAATAAAHDAAVRASERKRCAGVLRKEGERAQFRLVSALIEAIEALD